MGPLRNGKSSGQNRPSKNVSSWLSIKICITISTSTVVVLLLFSLSFLSCKLLCLPQRIHNSNEEDDFNLKLEMENTIVIFKKQSLCANEEIVPRWIV